MSYLVRRIQINNWMENNDFLSADEVKADGITLDLKSGKNTISLWEIDSLEEMQDAAISISTGRNEICDFYVLAIPREFLDAKFEIEKNEGETDFIKFKDKHYDLINMTFGKLKLLVDVMLYAFTEDERIYDFVYTDNRERMIELVNSGEMDKITLKPRIKKDLKVK